MTPVKKERGSGDSAQRLRIPARAHRESLPSPGVPIRRGFSCLAAIRAAAILAVVLGGSLPALAQSRPDALVYVRDDDPAIARAFEQAREHVAKADWTDAIDAYLSILDRHTDELVPWGPRTHMSAALAAHRELTDLPPDGRRALVARFEETLAPELARATIAHDTDALARIAEAPPVPSAARAALHLARIYRERDEIGRALRWLHRIAFLYPQGTDGIDISTVYAEIAFCRARAGQRPFYDALAIARTERGDTELAIRVGGTPTTLGNFVESLEPDAEAATAPWTDFGGRPSRDRDIAFAPELQASLATPARDLEIAWRFGSYIVADDATPSPDPRPIGPEQDPNPVQPLAPVEYGDNVIAYDKQTAFAISNETGETVWLRSLRDVGAPPEGDERTYFYGAAGEGRFALLHEALDDPDAGFFGISDTHRRLVVLDANNGEIQWSRGGPLDDAKELEELEFTGIPIIAGGRVFIGAQQSSDNEGEVKSYTVAFDLATGKLAWTVFLCSSPALESHRHVFTDGPTLSSAEGLLYCGTDIGVISAIDPDDGEHVWCFRYERVPYRTRDDSRLIYSFFESWSDNPMIVADGRIYATPGDSQYLHILLHFPDRKTGFVQLDRIAKARYRYLVGVRDRVVYLAGRDESNRYHVVSAFHPEGGERSNLWQFPVPNPDPDREGPTVDQPAGRAALAGGRVLLPTLKGLYVLDADDGALVVHVPNPDPMRARFGNLFGSGGRMHTAYGRQVNCFRPADG